MGVDLKIGVDWPGSGLQPWLVRSSRNLRQVFRIWFFHDDNGSMITCGCQLQQTEIWTSNSNKKCLWSLIHPIMAAINIFWKSTSSCPRSNERNVSLKSGASQHCGCHCILMIVTSRLAPKRRLRARGTAGRAAQTTKRTPLVGWFDETASKNRIVEHDMPMEY